MKIQIITQTSTAEADQVAEEETEETPCARTLQVQFPVECRV